MHFQSNTYLWGKRKHDLWPVFTVKTPKYWPLVWLNSVLFFPRGAFWDLFHWNRSTVSVPPPHKVSELSLVWKRRYLMKVSKYSTATVTLSLWLFKVDVPSGRKKHPETDVLFSFIGDKKKVSDTIYIDSSDSSVFSIIALIYLIDGSSV